MPTGVPLQQLSNQTFSVTLDDNLYEITLKATNGVMAVTIVENGTTVVENARAVACGAIIQSEYLEAGNFMFLTANEQLPNYEQFSLTQSLLYFTADELAAFRVAPTPDSTTVPTVTADFFNPVASLPLRFSPQGYVES